MRQKITFLLFLILFITLGVFVYYLIQKDDTSPDNTSAAEEMHEWGMIANPVHQGEKSRSALIFAGPRNFSYEDYSRMPLNKNVWEWKTEEDVDYILDEINGAYVNVIKLSWWGLGEEITWSPAKYTTEIHRDLFDEANERGILVAPYLEVSPWFPFWEQYPDNTTEFESRIKKVIELFGDKENWLELYDKNGEPRKVIWLIETIHQGSVDEKKFAQTFDIVANKIYLDTGVKIGFIIDPTPLPANGSYNGPNITELKQINSLLAVNPFNITSDGTTEQERLNKSEEISKKWSESGIPFMGVILPGYDDSLIGGRVSQVYGDNPFWRSQVRRIALEYETVGISLDIWNGFTEGYTFVPTEQFGDIDYKLAKDVFFEISPKTCSNNLSPDQCGENKPVYCDNSFRVANNCSKCGCQNGYSCQSDGSCTEQIQTCSDGTLPGQCSATKPKYCDNGNLIDKCSVCGCESGFECDSTEHCSDIIVNKVICGPLDVNSDNKLSILDLGSFVSVYSKECSDTPPTTGCKGKDINLDGKVNLIDLGAFVKLYIKSSCL